MHSSANTTFIDYDGHHIHFNDDSNVVYNDHHEGDDVEEDEVHADEEEFVMHKLNNLQLTLNVPHFHGITKPDDAIRAAIIDHDEHHDEVDHHHQHHPSQNHESHHENGGHHSTPAVEILRKPVHFQHTKQHTGLKNVSRNVGLAVSPGAKMEFDQEFNEGFGSVKINRPIGGLKSHLGSGSHEHLNDAESTSSRESESSRLTEQGFVDLKFYHNKLW